MSFASFSNSFEITVKSRISVKIRFLVALKKHDKHPNEIHDEDSVLYHNYAF